MKYQMSTMQIRYALFIFSILILAGCTVAQPNNPSPTRPTTDSTSSPSPTPYQVTGSLLSLLDGTDKQCRWNGKVQDYDVSGVIFTSGMNFRAEVKTKVSFLPVTGYAVGNGQTVTAWANVAPDKKVIRDYQELTKLASQSPADNSTTDPILSQFISDQTFTCESWIVEPAAFTTPQ